MATGSSWDLSGTVIGPDGVGVTIYWFAVGDYPSQTDFQHLLLNGVDSIIGYIIWGSDEYDY
jgi:hypothetical protein